MTILNKKYANFDIRKKCLSCSTNNLTEILDLGFHSFADRFVKKKDLKKKRPLLPFSFRFV